LPDKQSESESEPQDVGPKSFWSGTISFGLVSVPVALYSATRGVVGSSLRMLAPDGAPLRREYVCPEHERALEPEEIVRAYELDDGERVVIDDTELEALPGRRAASTARARDRGRLPARLGGRADDRRLRCRRRCARPAKIRPSERGHQTPEMQRTRSRTTAGPCAAKVPRFSFGRQNGVAEVDQRTDDHDHRDPHERISALGLLGHHALAE
jgi:hypothetical protein